MLTSIWHNVFFDPIYNGLVFFIDTIPGGDVGVAIICIVVVVKTLLLPLSVKAAKTQKIMREIEPKLKEIKEQHKENREAQALAMMAVYKEAGLNPFASIFLMLLQIPILFALYYSVYNGGGIALPEINTGLLYSFIANPAVVTMNFLGVIDITGKSFLLAVIAGVTQYIQFSLALPALPPKKEGEEPNFKDDFMRTMQLQMRYVMPVIIGVVGYVISAAIALYFVVSNLMAILQELYVRRHR